MLTLFFEQLDNVKCHVDCERWMVLILTDHSKSSISPPSCADCLEMWESQPPGTLRACPGL